ncbi:mCG59407, partial [Mus musculus]
PHGKPWGEIAFKKEHGEEYPEYRVEAFALLFQLSKECLPARCPGQLPVFRINKCSDLQSLSQISFCWYQDFSGGLNKVLSMPEIPTMIEIPLFLPRGIQPTVRCGIWTGSCLEFLLCLHFTIPRS